MWDIVFLDRDGTLNRLFSGYRTMVDFATFPDAMDAVARLNQLAKRVVVVTNQRGLATRILTRPQLDEVHDRLRADLDAAGAHIDAIYVCPHNHNECDCRKPLPGLLRRALADAPWADAKRCLMFGDSDADAGAAQAAGVPFHRVDFRTGLKQADVDTALETASAIRYCGSTTTRA